MAKKKEQKKELKVVAVVGGNLSDGSRFEKGDDLSAISQAEMEALLDLRAIEISEEGE